MAKIVNLNNRAARRRAKHNAEVAANAQPIMAVILHAKRAIKRDGTVGAIKQVAFCEPSEVNKQRAVAELLDWAYNYGGTKESEETGIARILSPEATVIYREIKAADIPDLAMWARLFMQLERDKVSFLTEERTLGTGPTQTV